MVNDNAQLSTNRLKQSITAAKYRNQAVFNGLSEILSEAPV